MPPPEPVDPNPIRVELEADADIPALVEGTAGGESAPIAAGPVPVDRYELMREFRKQARAEIPFWHLRERIRATRVADGEAAEAADVAVEQRADEQRADQARLDGLWTELVEARRSVARELPDRVAAETERRIEERRVEQASLDDDWRRLLTNDPATTMGLLEIAFADNDAPAAAIDCEGDVTTVVMWFVGPAAIVPERKPARTPTGKRTLKKRTKTELNRLYLAAMGSNVLATLKETFAVAPGTDTVQLLVVRRETSGKLEGDLVALYAARFARHDHAGASGGRDPARALELAEEALLNIKGQAETVSPLDLRRRDDLATVLAQVDAGLRT